MSLSSNNSREFRLVDAFTSTPFSGNVAGVILDADGLADARMQALAAELSAPETTFILPPTIRDAAVRFRWFTPACEVGFCGHATLGAVHALLESGRFAHAFAEPGTILPIESRSGILTVRTERAARPGAPGYIWLDMPHNEPKKSPIALPNIARYLGLDPAMIDPALPPIRTHDDDIILAVVDAPTLFSLRPAMSDLARYEQKEGIRGILVTTLRPLTPLHMTQSRFFAPAAGIDEDPVTGSVHGPLGLHLVRTGIVELREGKADFLCAQSKAGGRAGIVRVVVTREGESNHHVRIGGSCVTTAAGSLIVPPIQ